MNSGSVLLVVLAVVFLWARTSGRGSVAHGHGAKVRQHEGAHLAAAKRIGAPVSAAWVRDNSGLVQLAHPEKLSSRDYMAFMKAGEKATGGQGCSGDREMVRQEKKRMRAAGMTAAEVRRVERQADADARRYAREAKKWGARL